MKRNLFKRKLRRALAASLGAIAFSSSAFVVNAVSELDIYRYFNSPAFNPDSGVRACVGANRHWHEGQAQQAVTDLNNLNLRVGGQPLTFVLPQVGGAPQNAGKEYEVEVACGPVKIPARLVANELSTNLHLAAKDNPNGNVLQNGPNAKPVNWNVIGMFFGDDNVIANNNTATKDWAQESWRVALAKKEKEKAIEDDKKATEERKQQQKQEELNRKKLMTGPQETTQKKNNINTNTLLTNFSAAAAVVPIAGAAVHTAQTMIPTPNMPETTIPQKN